MENKQENIHNDSHSNEHTEQAQIHHENIPKTENVKLVNEEQHNIKDDAKDKDKSNINHSDKENLKSELKIENNEKNIINESQINDNKIKAQIETSTKENDLKAKLVVENKEIENPSSEQKQASIIKEEKKLENSSHQKQSSNHENDIKVEVPNSFNHQDDNKYSNNENKKNYEKKEMDKDEEDKNKPTTNHKKNKPSNHEKDQKLDEIIIEDPYQNKSNIPEFDIPNMGGFSPTQEQYEEMQRQIQMYMDELESTLKSATTLKEAGNKHFSNQDYVQAETNYLKGKKLVEDFNTQYFMIIRSIPPTDKSKTLSEEFFKILSNLSNTYIKQEKNIESIELDKYILTYINPNWDKSYGRLIQAYLNLGKLNEANKIYENFKLIKDFDKYKDKHQFVINQLEERNFKNIENLKKSASMPNNQEGQFLNPDSQSISDIASQGDVKKRKKKKTNSFGMYAKYLLGGFFLMGGLFSFYFIYRNNFKKMLNSKNN